MNKLVLKQAIDSSLEDQLVYKTAARILVVEEPGDGMHSVLCSTLDRTKAISV